MPLAIRVIGNLSPRRLAMLPPPSDTQPQVLFVWDYQRQALADTLAAHGETLKWAHFRRVGVPETVLSLFSPYPHIELTNGSGASGIAVAEHALALLLALTKRLPELQEHQRTRAWRHDFSATELYKRTACVVGLGDVGRQTARLLKAFGVHVLGVHRTAAPVAEVDETFSTDQLSAALERASILVLAPALTAQTKNLIGAEQLARLPAGALVINVGRGAVLDEPALIAALRSGHLGGAGLDVLAQEPPAPDSPLWELPNVVLTPHSAAHTEATDDRSVELFLEKLRRFQT